MLLLLLLFLSVCTNNIISNTHDLNIYIWVTIVFLLVSMSRIEQKNNSFWVFSSIRAENLREKLLFKRRCQGKKCGLLDTILIPLVYLDCKWTDASSFDIACIRRFQVVLVSEFDMKHIHDLAKHLFRYMLLNFSWPKINFDIFCVWDMGKLEV